MTKLSFEKCLRLTENGVHQLVSNIHNLRMQAPRNSTENLTNVNTLLQNFVKLINWALQALWFTIISLFCMVLGKLADRAFSRQGKKEI